MNTKEIKEIKDNLITSSSKGFGLFFKNILMIILISLIMFICANPNIIMHPENFIKDFNGNIFYTIGILFILICAAYQLGISINKDAGLNNKANIIKEIKSAEEDLKAFEKVKHDMLIQKRIQNGPIIRNELKDLLLKLGADRASICEMHNGTNSLAGVPFLYLDMTYEEKSNDIEYYISEDFHNFNLTRYPFMATHVNNGTWIGSWEDVLAEDEHLALKLKLGECRYGAWIVLRGSHSFIGFLWVTFKDKDDHPDKATIMSALMSSAQVLSPLLDKDINN